MCERNEYTSGEGRGIILVPSHHESIYVLLHLPSLVPIETELHHDDSPTYTTLPCQPRAWERQSNTRIACLAFTRHTGQLCPTTRAEQSAHTHRCPHGTSASNLRTSKQMQHSFSAASASIVIGERISFGIGSSPAAVSSSCSRNLSPSLFAPPPLRRDSSHNKTLQASKPHTRRIAALIRRGCRILNGHMHESMSLLPGEEYDMFLHIEAEAQAMQSAASSLPEVLENVFSGHGVHSLGSLPALILYVPAGHSRH